MEYFAYIDGKQAGPMSVEQMYGKGITAETLVWHAGLTDWVRADSLPELAPVIGGATRGPQAAEKEALETAVNTETMNTEGDAPDSPATPKKKKKKGMGCLYAIIILVILALVMGATNPNRDDHWNRISSQIEEGIAESGADEDDPIGLGAIFKSVASQVINTFGKSYFSVDDYYLFSVGKMNIDGTSKPISLGMFNHVFTFDKEDVKREIENGMKEKMKKKVKNSIKDTINEIIPMEELKELFDLDGLMKDNEEME